MEKLLAWFNPTNLIALAVALCALIGMGWWGVSTLIGIGEDRATAVCAATRAVAVKAQGTVNEAAVKEHIVTETIVEVQYRDDIKEVIRYAPPADTACPADADFLRNYND